MPLGRLSILIYALGDKIPAENPTAIQGEFKSSRRSKSSRAVSVR